MPASGQKRKRGRNSLENIAAGSPRYPSGIGDRSMELPGDAVKKPKKASAIDSADEKRLRRYGDYYRI
jgi:hypothetical protein